MHSLWDFQSGWNTALNLARVCDVSTNAVYSKEIAPVAPCYSRPCHDAVGRDPSKRFESSRVLAVRASVEHGQPGALKLVGSQNRSSSSSELLVSPHSPFQWMRVRPPAFPSFGIEYL